MVLLPRNDLLERVLPRASRSTVLPTPEQDDRGPRAGSPWPARLDGIGILLAPLLLFVVLRMPAMTARGLVDPWIYTGYAHNGPDLVRRFGTEPYYWVRLGAIVPEAVSSAVFGPVGGFYVLRYLLALLAIVPLFVLVRRHVGRETAWVVATVVLACPATWLALGTDYPDGFCVAYLLAGSALLAAARRPSRRGYLLTLGAGVLLSLAVHSQVVVAPLVVCVALGVSAVDLRRAGMRFVLARGAQLAATFVVVTLGLALVAHVWLGSGNIIAPTVTNYRLVSQPDQLKMWHSADWHWVLGVPNLVVPYVVVALWLTSLLRRRDVPYIERAVGVTATLAAATWAVMQFVGTVATLEYRLYSSSLWALVLPLAGLALARLAGPRESPQRVAALAVVTTFAASSFVTLPASSVTGVLVVVPVLVLLTAVAARGWLTSGRGVTACTTVAVIVTVLLTVVPSTKVPTPDGATVGLPPGDYSNVFGHPERFAGDLTSYRLAAQLPAVIGPGSAGHGLIFWFSGSVDFYVVNDLAATYLWRFMPTGLPTTDAGRADILQRTLYARARPLVLVTSTPQEVPEYLDVFTAQGHSARVTHQQRLVQGATSIVVSVVDVAGVAAGA